MAANYLHSLADENPDLQKQIGCVKGVFQIFNRHHIVSRRRYIRHSRKQAHPGSLLFNDGTPERESSVISQRSPNVEKHRISTESSKDSFSSWSPSSPFSNVDYNIDNHQNVDHKGVVKDSTYREAHGLSNETIMEKDSINWYCDEPRELSRSKSCQFKDGFSFSVSKDYPRFSFDGRETNNLTIKTDFKITNPRLSLDSKERSIRTLNSVSLVPVKPSNLSRDPKTNDGADADMDLSQTRPPGVVAKLMGLETYPLSKSLNSSEDCGSIIKKPNSTRSTLREPTSPCWKSIDVKPISRVPIEAAPWKQRDGARAMTSSTKTRGPVGNVYGEVDKRLKNLEFAESGKDLRALKQILEAMQAVEARSSDHSNCQDTLSESKESGPESHIVIMKPATNKTAKSLITESTRGGRRSRVSNPVTDCSKPRKQPKKQQPDSRTRKWNVSSTPEKSTLLVKVGEQLTPEHPSPVSVLDESVYVDNSPSPVKHTPIIKKDDTPKSANNIIKARYEAGNNAQSKTLVSYQITREKLKKVGELVEKLKNLNSSHNESPTDYIASLCENTNPNSTYISQILLASGFLLRDLESFTFHPSGHPINPELFLVLEHTKFSNLQKGKFHRKLIFDAVNEILVGKFSSDFKIMMMQDHRKILKELCLEIEQLQVHEKRDECEPGNGEDDLKHIFLEDLSKKSENWTGFYGESRVIGMEIERLIFRDLVNEVMTYEL
ncbi:hypothetical protein QVD17_15917 [Tagetes erecta]|uniref:DUF4378 domain-containing protein n=1 Tax=Tagetes erecta TaxID=13708 RepID=A0AAD8P039_TARER|nr:hypothetical protein QVD17_15917 [Tagetes erecta]